jgi:hypothetical protein
MGKFKMSWQEEKIFLKKNLKKKPAAIAARRDIS